MFLRISRFSPSLSLTTQAPSLPAHFYSSAKDKVAVIFHSQPDPNSRITHCLPGIAILLPSPLNVTDADVTQTQTPTSSRKLSRGFGRPGTLVAKSPPFVLLKRCRGSSPTAFGFVWKPTGCLEINGKKGMGKFQASSSQSVKLIPGIR